MPPHEHAAFVPVVSLVALALSALAVAGADARGDDGAETPLHDPSAARAERIVSLALAADEVLLALVGPEHIAALDEFADDAASNVRVEARRVPRRVRSSVEDVLAERPDLVLCSAWASAEVLAALRHAGVRVELLAPPTTLEEVARNVRQVGHAVAEDAAAEALVRDMDARIAAVRARRAGRAGPRVLIRSTEGVTPGAGTLAAAVIDAAGGRLVTAEMGLRGFVPLPVERALGLDVDIVIVDAYRADGRARSIGSDLALTSLARRARVVEVPPNLLMTTSHHVASTIEYLAAAFDAEAR